MRGQDCICPKAGIYQEGALDLIVRLQRETLNIMTTSQGLDDEHNFLLLPSAWNNEGQNFRLDEIVTRDTYEA